MHIKTAIWYMVSNSFESLNVVSINMFPILMMSVRKFALGFLKIKVFWSKNCDVINFGDDFSNIVLSRGANYIVDMATWIKLGIPSISMRDVSKTSMLYGFDQKSKIFGKVHLFQVQ